MPVKIYMLARKNSEGEWEGTSVFSERRETIYTNWFVDIRNGYGKIVEYCLAK